MGGAGSAAATAPELTAMPAPPQPCQSSGHNAGIGWRDFHLNHADVVADDCQEKIQQWKASSQLRLLRPLSACAGNALPTRSELLQEAEARGLDGALVCGTVQDGGCGIVALLRPDEQLLLIDDDKKEG